MASDLQPSATARTRRSPRATRSRTRGHPGASGHKVNPTSNGANSADQWADDLPAIRDQMRMFQVQTYDSSTIADGMIHHVHEDANGRREWYEPWYEFPGPREPASPTRAGYDSSGFQKRAARLESR